MTTYAGDFLGLPGLRGFWPMNAFDASGNAIDQAGSDLVLTYNGNPGYNFTTQGAGYLTLDGTGDYLSRADEATLDVTGTETTVASAVRGMTVGGWFWVNALGSTQALIAKDDVGANRQFSMYVNSSDKLVGELFLAGAATTVTSTGTYTAAAWHLFIVRFQPSSSWCTFVDKSKTTNSTSIPASISNTAAAFHIGARNAALLLTGRASNCFLCAMALSDATLDSLYDNTKAAYGL